jgi:phage protein U
VSNRTTIDDFITGLATGDTAGASWESFWADHPVQPSAILTDLLVWVPLFAVDRMTLTESYRMPPVGSAGLRAAVGNSEDRVQLSGLLIGEMRFVWKQALELLADLSRRGGSLGMLTGGGVNGLFLVTKLAVKLDMQVTSLTFTASAQRRDALDVSIGLQHVPRPGAQHLLVDLGATAVSTGLEFL